MMIAAVDTAYRPAVAAENAAAERKGVAAAEARNAAAAAVVFAAANDALAVVENSSDATDAAVEVAPVRLGEPAYGVAVADVSNAVAEVFADALAGAVLLQQRCVAVAADGAWCDDAAAVAEGCGGDAGGVVVAVGNVVEVW